MDEDGVVAVWWSIAVRHRASGFAIGHSYDGVESAGGQTGSRPKGPGNVAIAAASCWSTAGHLPCNSTGQAGGVSSRVSVRAAVTPWRAVVRRVEGTPEVRCVTVVRHGTRQALSGSPRRESRALAINALGGLCRR